MIKWFKNRRLQKRIFYSETHKDLFLKRCAISKSEHYVAWISQLKQAIVSNDMTQIQARQKYLSSEGIKPPKTLSQCDQLIKDLREWREI